MWLVLRLMLLSNLVFGINSDCLNVIQLAYNMNMANAEPSNWASLNADCCQDTGRTVCDSNGRVTWINWVGGLSGFFNFTAFLSLTSLESINLPFQSLSGTFPDRLQDSLIHFSLYSNSGGATLNAPTFKAPKYITHLDLGYVNIVGGFSKDAFPKSLISINFLRCGSLTGNLYLYAPTSVQLLHTGVKKIFVVDPSNLSGDMSYSQLSTSQTNYLPGGCDRTGIIQDTDCGHLKTFAQNLNLDTVNATLFGQVSTNCCIAMGVKCEINSNSIVEINWSGLGLDGMVDISSLEYLSKLQSLNISSNQLTGKFPLDFYSHFQSLDISNNLFEGPLTEIILPGIQTLEISGNRFTGNLPILPDSLTKFVAANNALTGQIQAFPNSLTIFIIDNNFVNGSIPSLNSVVTFSATRNKLSGNLPTFTNTLTSFAAASNKLNGSIPALGQFMRSLDVSQNQLSGQFPTLNLRIISLNISRNRLNDDVTNVAFPNSMKIVDLSFNNLNGIPTLKSPSYVDLGNNALNTVVFLSTSYLIYCNLINNPMDVEIPICNYYTSRVNTLTSLIPDTISSISTTPTNSILVTIATRPLKVSHSLQGTSFITNDVQSSRWTSTHLSNLTTVSISRYRFGKSNSMQLILSLSIVIRIAISGILLGMFVTKIPWSHIFRHNRGNRKIIMGTAGSYQ
eukprot:NODE_97_length_20652_cov_0.832093.p2 type:complete len:680 gc:universal NODE_97_length_20652_cov_0.832093:2143-4182(+)